MSIAAGVSMDATCAVEEYLSGPDGRRLCGDQRELVRRMARLYGVEPTHEVVALLALAAREAKKCPPCSPDS